MNAALMFLKPQGINPAGAELRTLQREVIAQTLKQTTTGEQR